MVVVANFSDRFRVNYQIPHFPENGTWHEWTKNDKVESQNNQLTLDLGEYEAQALVWQ